MHTIQSKHGKKISRKTLFKILGVEVVILILLVSLAMISTSRQVILECIRGVGNLRIADFFEIEAENLPGLIPDEIQEKLEGEGLSCQSLGEDDAGRNHLKCAKSTNQLGIEVLILGISDERVDLIDINVNQTGEPSDDEATLYLCEISSLVMGDSKNDSTCDWIRKTLPAIQNANDVHKNSFSGVRYILYGVPESRSLEIGRLP